MSYAKCQVIYGVPLTEKILELIGDDEPEDHGFETLYSGSAAAVPGYCGVSVFQFDECESYRRWSDFTAQTDKVTEKQKNKALVLFDKLESNIKEALKEDGIEGPDLFMVWHTS